MFCHLLAIFSPLHFLRMRTRHPLRCALAEVTASIFQGVGKVSDHPTRTSTSDLAPGGGGGVRAPTIGTNNRMTFFQSAICIFTADQPVAFLPFRESLRLTLPEVKRGIWRIS